MQITFQRMRKNCLTQDNDWNELLEHDVRIIKRQAYVIMINILG